MAIRLSKNVGRVSASVTRQAHLLTVMLCNRSTGAGLKSRFHSGSHQVCIVPVSEATRCDPGVLFLAGCCTGFT